VLYSGPRELSIPEVGVVSAQGQVNADKTEHEHDPENNIQDVFSTYQLAAD
jgi:hypothetical protein